jgi:hypothetical protein
MWIFLSDAFLSIVAHRDKPGVHLVRARAAGDIKRVFPEAKVLKTPTADYAYRAEIPAEKVADVIAKKLLTIDYPNFKNTVAESWRHHAYMDVWSDMARHAGSHGVSR